jgi:hypothetical protein
MEVAIIRPRKHPIIRGLWRYFVTGRTILGGGDNATFLRDATVDRRGGPVEKLTRARWRRVARRHAALTVPAALLACDWRACLAYAALAVLAGGTYGAHTALRWWPQRSVRREFVIPTWQVVASILGVKARRKDAIRNVVLPDGFGRDQAEESEPLVVRIHLPAVPLDEGTRKRIAAAAGGRLGIPDPSAHWEIRGAHAFVDLSPRVNAPASLRFSDVRTLWEEASPTRPFVGLAARREPVYADMDNDGPHMGVSGSTGTGKSTLLRVVLSKRVQSGAALVCCDYKVISHQWARRIAQTSSDRVLYVCDPEPINDAILAVYSEFERRRELLKTDASALSDVRPVDLLVEEVNSLANILRKWWRGERRRILMDAKANGEEAPDVPAVPPCVDALAALVQMGRELQIRVHFAAQRLDAAALSPQGGGAIRESITNRFLAGYTKAAWNMLCAGVPYVAFPGGPRGIWTACVGGEVTHFRVPPMTNDEAYELAMSGQEPAGPVLGEARWVPAAGRKVALCTLGEAWELIPGCPSLDALRKAVYRAHLDAVEQRGKALCYDMADLMALYPRVLESS